MNEYEQERRKKIGILRGLGILPFSKGAASLADIDYIAKTVSVFGPSATKEHRTEPVAARGRIVQKRDFGKLSFLSIRDDTGDLQVALSKNSLTAEDWSVRDNLDYGDLVVAQGPLGRTDAGELTLWAMAIELSAKALLPPPAKHDGLSDVEIRYRQRHMDLFTNRNVMKAAMQRSEIIRQIRLYMHSADYMEVETPILQPLHGGATAEPFETHHNSLDIPLYLRIAPELYLKRLLFGGMSRVYEIGKNFRNEGISPRHNPEFTAIEAYQAWGNMHTMLGLTERLIKHVVQAMDLNHPTIDFKREFDMVSIPQLLADHQTKTGEIVNDVGNWFETNVQPTLIRPTFCLYPLAAQTPLAKTWNGDYADAYELIINGIEIGCGYSEQNDPDAQLAAFQFQSSFEEGQVPDTDFIEAMKAGMPPAGGMGLGIDRLVMTLLNLPSVKDVILFPLMRPAAVVLT